MAAGPDPDQNFFGPALSTPRPGPESPVEIFFSLGCRERDANLDDVERYCQREFFTSLKDLGEFWKDISSQFTGLSVVARDILTISATSCECERQFSKLLHLNTDYRSDLSSECLLQSQC
jgi:hypothetical protein